MSFDEYHSSYDESQPVNLYTFTIGQKKLYYTSAESNVIANGITYKAYAGLKHSKLSNSGQDSKNKVKVTVTRSFELATWLLTYVPTAEIFLTIHTYERKDIYDEDVIYEFSGVYLEFTSKYPLFEMQFAPLDYDIRKKPMKYSFGPICQHTQYDPICGLVAANFTETGLISSTVGGAIITDIALDAVSAHHFEGGYIEVDGIYGIERAWILSQTGGNTIEVDRLLPSVGAGKPIRVISSCRGEFDRCRDPALYNNQARFFGAINANKVNPFNSSGIKSSV